MKIGIIGTAGRVLDAKRLTVAHFTVMCEHTEKLLQTHGIGVSDRHFVSGGAAWADHVAVRLFLQGRAAELTLHLPTQFYLTGRYCSSPCGLTANRLHHAFSTATQCSSLGEVLEALDRGANHTTSNGFLARNYLVGQCDMLIAYTFGSGDQPKEESGTRHCWEHSAAPVKIHVGLNEMLRFSSHRPV